MKARAIAEADGRIKEQRDNEDVFSRQMKVRLEQERITRLEAINATFKNLGESLNSFIGSPTKIMTTVAALTAAAGGVYAMRETARVAGRLIEKRLGTPSLVRETSRSTGHFALRRQLSRMVGLAKPEEGYSLTDVVLRSEIAERIQRLAVSVKNTQANAAPYRHMLFYGPPGTGKTMVAKRLARVSGMDYAIMSGGDVGPLGRDAVTELHKMFDWANTSKRGLLLFIDEADAFLASRSRQQMSEDQRNALNALLFRTGEASKKFMLVMATNRPGDLDRAIGDRVDEAMIFDLPDEPARRKLVKQYFQKYIVESGSEARTGPFGLFQRAAARIQVEGIDDAYLDGIAHRTEGFSGREIAKLMISVQGNVYGRSSTKLTQEIMEETVQWKLKEHDAKDSFATSDAFDFVATPKKAGHAGASSNAVRVAVDSAPRPTKPELK
jgi:ATPase family AAA domain-containing protein 3A/B